MGHFILATFLAALLAYLLGSCNSAILFSKLIKGQDIRELGSHNASGASARAWQDWYWQGICSRA